MYFEIYRKNKLIKRGDDILNDLEWDNELMYVPTLSLTLPILYHDYITGRDEIKVYVNEKVFWGIVEGLTENKDDETIDVDLSHVVNEWTYRQISINNAIKDQNVNVIFKGSKEGEKNGQHVSANPFEILLTEKMTDKKYISRSCAVAWDDQGEKIPIASVDSSKVQKKPGSYDISFSTAKGAKVTVKVTVKKLDGTRTRTNDGVTVAAVPFEMTVDDVNMSDAKYIERAFAMAWKENGDSVAISDVDHSKVKARVGSYTVKYKAGNATVSIKVKVLESGAEIVTPDTDTKNPNLKDASVIDQIDDIFADTNFAYPGWKLNMSEEAENTTIDYVYSRQNKLEALTKTMELTTDLFWRVRFVNEKVIDISDFGDKKSWIISMKPSGANNIRMIEEPEIKHSFDKVVNLATVYSEKSDSGMTSLTMREVYNDESLQKDGFPCVIIRANVNNERDYSKYTTQYPKLAPNNWLEYAVIDEESVALEGGVLIEGTFAFNDLSPFNNDTDSDGKTREIKDKDRIKAAKTAYRAAIRKLKHARRSYELKIRTEELPVGIAPGDRVRFIYDNSLYILDSCSSYMKKILSYDDWFYVTKIHYEIGQGEVETNEITLEKYLRIDRNIKE